MFQWIAMIWNEFAMSISFIFIMPVVIGISVAILVYIGDVRWENNINNPLNDEFVIEVAFNLDIEPEEVTQRQFNQRY